MSPDSAKQTWTVTEPYLNLRCGLGEGPYYEPATNTLRFVDIIKQRLHTISLDQDQDQTRPPPPPPPPLQLDTPISVTADVEGLDPRETLLIGAKHGLALLDRRSGAYEYLARFHTDPGQGDSDGARIRSNDGAVDPDGRFWMGSMTDFGLGPFQPEGSLYLFDGAKPAQKKKDPVTIPNSVSWSPDGGTMYFTESAEAAIYASDYHRSADGTDVVLSNERVLYKHAGPGPGVPDGHRVDVDGNLWSAFYGGSCVLKISPAGEVLGEVKLPTKNITCTEFVGTELFITTASLEEGEGTPEEVANSGALYRVDVGVRGLAPYKFKLSKK